MKRGQSAIEYLTTYGWAILILLVVIAALFWLGVINPKSVLQSSCFFPADMSCRAYVMNTTGYVALDLGQSTGHPINVTNFLCTSQNNPALITPLNNPVVIVNGDHQLITDGTQQCLDSSGDIASGSAGNQYKGKIFIEYVELDTGFTHTVAGDVSLKYEEVAMPTPQPTSTPTSTPGPG